MRRCRRDPVNLHSEGQFQCNGFFKVELEQKEIQLNERHSPNFSVVQGGWYRTVGTVWGES